MQDSSSLKLIKQMNEELDNFFDSSNVKNKDIMQSIQFYLKSNLRSANTDSLYEMSVT